MRYSSPIISVWRQLVRMWQIVDIDGARPNRELSALETLEIFLSSTVCHTKQFFMVIIIIYQRKKRLFLLSKITIST